MPRTHSDASLSIWLLAIVVGINSIQIIKSFEKDIFNSKEFERMTPYMVSLDNCQALW